MLGSALMSIQPTNLELLRYTHWPVQEKTWFGWFDTLTCGMVYELDSLELWAVAIARTAHMSAYLLCYLLAFYDRPVSLGA